MKRLTTIPQAALIKCCDCIEESNCYSDISCDEINKGLEKLRAYEDTGLTPEEIIDGKLLTGWIEVEERLPDEPECGIVDMDSLKEYIVMIDHASLPTFLLYAGDGEWYRDGDYYKVLAWMPLPEPYKPQHLASADNDTAQSGLQSAT